MDWLTIVSAVTTANIVTACFLWGMTKAARIGADDAAPFVVVMSLLGPLAVVGVGAVLFGK